MIRLAIELSGGIVTGVHASAPDIAVDIVDWDDIADDEQHREALTTNNVIFGNSVRKDTFPYEVF